MVNERADNKYLNSYNGDPDSVKDGAPLGQDGEQVSRQS